jgi:hypothetical protein
VSTLSGDFDNFLLTVAPWVEVQVEYQKTQQLAEEYLKYSGYSGYRAKLPDESCVFKDNAVLWGLKVFCGC